MPAARELAREILLRVERSGAYASILLDAYETRLADRREAGMLHELVLGVLRRRAVLDHVIDRCSRRKRIDDDVRIALRIGAYALLFLDRVPEFAAVDSAVELVKRGGKPGAAGFVNGVLRAMVRQGPDLLPAQPASGDVDGLAVYHSHPAWWVRRRVERFGEEQTTALLEANNRPAATVLRANRSRIEPGELVRRLEQAGVEVESCRFAPDAIRVRGGDLRGAGSLEQGLLAVQDQASQLVGRLFGPRPGPWIGDLCAAPGSKTMQIAEAMAPDAHLVAVDRHAGRLARLIRGARRLGAARVSVVRADMAGEAAPFRERFSHLLVDAPCSGTGTLRRHPEIRWRLDESDLPALAARQGRLLDSAARLAAPGARVVYSVCSLEPEEGEEVVRAFLARSSGFRRMDAGEHLPGSCAPLIDGDGQLRTSPLDDGMDGFFAAILIRGDDGCPSPADRL